MSYSDRTMRHHLDLTNLPGMGKSGALRVLRSKLSELKRTADSVPAKVRELEAQREAALTAQKWVLSEISRIENGGTNGGR